LIYGFCEDFLILSQKKISIKGAPNGQTPNIQELYHKGKTFSRKKVMVFHYSN